jgi:hypothetical protein
MRPAFATAQFPRRRDRDISNEIMGRAKVAKLTKRSVGSLRQKARTLGLGLGDQR